MNEVNIKLGDVVRLKSGGPMMTIYEMTDNRISCKWFDEKHNLRYGTFQNEELRNINS